MQTVIIFIVVILVLVVAHELGHFFVAKLFKVKVDEFGIGYPPRARKLFTKGGTLFTLNWLPFGGFVKIVGETGGDGENPNSFQNQKLWKRLSIIAAGVIANIILAIVLYSISFSIGFLGSTKDFPKAIVVSPERIIINEVQKGSPSELAGFQASDSILALSSGKDQSTPVTVSEVIGFVRTHGDEVVRISIQRKDTIKTIEVTPIVGVTGNNPGIGVSLAEAAKLRYSPIRAIGVGAEYACREFGAIIVSLAKLSSGAFGGSRTIWSEISGPVGIAQYAGSAYGHGMGTFLIFVALISVNLAVINLLPFPALDGGRFILEIFSSKGKSRISSRVIAIVNQIGFLLLIGLMLYVTYHDIARLIT